jgi:hypothetical protein
MNPTWRPRERVRGSGPSRQFLPPFQPLLQIPEEVISDLLSFYKSNADENDLLESEHYQISDHCPLKMKVPRDFQHLILTRALDGDPRSELNYAVWREDTEGRLFRNWFQEFFPGAFRVRISVLQPGTEFGWHIDANTSVGCRCSASLNQADAKFEVKARGRVYDVPLERGVVTFTNTGWQHRVYNPGATPRINLVFGSKYEDLARYLPASPVSLYQTDEKTQAQLGANTGSAEIAATV